MAKLLKKEKLDDLLEKLSSAGFITYGPVEKSGTTLFQPVKGGELLLDFENSRKPPKEILFPQTEKMFDLTIEDHKITGATAVKMPTNPILILGIRPCDVRAMNVLDKLFTDDYADPYYVDKRERATIVSFSCTGPTMPLETCFCTSVGGDPASEEGADMLWTDIGDLFLVESLNDKGENILKLGEGLFTDATVDHEKLADTAKQDTRDAIVRKLDTKGVTNALESAFDSNYWAELSQRCLGCGICTLLCPTCNCFDIKDVVANGEGRRERTWDSCQFPYYSVHASGHNPRPEGTQRQRNRIYHKFLYSEKNMGMVGCVGCGRCISGCPVNIDIIEVIEDVKALTDSGGKEK